MRRSYRYRLYPTRIQIAALHMQVDEACRLYNAAVEERRSAWRQKGLSLGYYDQAAQLKVIRAAGNLGVANFSACQDVLHRVERTFSAFFARVRRGERAGYPRFKPRRRYRTLAFPRYGDGCRVRPSGRLYVQGVGELKVKWHRPLLGNIKMMTLTREADKWYVCFVVDHEPESLPVSAAVVGIDLGLTYFLVTDDGHVVANPRHFRQAASRLRVAQRKLARRQNRSRRREKIGHGLVRLHAHIGNQRRDFHHKTARALVDAHGLIAVEDLNVNGLARSMLAKSVLDAGWGQFVRILAEKAANAGRILVAVNPDNTTQNCSECGERVWKDLKQRWHRCPACGCSLDRDINAARNILQRALDSRPGWGRQALTWGATPCVA